jgi:23S rRNA (pseudouridine1915-N3)-methyltransferase
VGTLKYDNKLFPLLRKERDEEKRKICGPCGKKKTNKMKICLLVIGKTDEAYLQSGIELFLKRIPHYLPFEMKAISDIKNSKNLSEDQQKEKEGELILQQISASDELFLLDEQGLEVSSVGFARFLEKKMVSGIKRLVFVIGGPYGFSGNVYSRAIGKVSLSKMTFSHQMVRLIFLEQLYRAMTILKGEPYHHM